MNSEVLLLLILIVLIFNLIATVINLRSQISALDVMRLLERNIDERAIATNKDLSQMLESGQEKEVIATARKRLEDQPRSSALFWYIGIAEYHLENWAAANTAFQKCIELEPRYKKELQDYTAIIDEKLRLNAS